MNPVIVIGMHRSGTSLIVKVLEKLGVFMGADQEHNGESLFFNTINEWILHQAHISWDNPENYKYFSDGAKETIIPIIKNRLKSFHKKKYFGKLRDQQSFSNINFPWGWKDPRSTFTIDIWKEIFPDLKIIHIYRNPIDVINSLRKREIKKIVNIGNPTRTGIKKKIYGYKLPQKNLFYQLFRCLELSGGFSLWKEYVMQALSLSGDSTKIIHISFEELIESPEKIVNDLSAFLEITKITISIKELINTERGSAFLNNSELVDFYKKIKNDELVKKLNYGDLIR